jgi:hypothetical protein
MVLETRHTESLNVGLGTSHKNVWFKALCLKRRLRFDIITAVIQFTQIKKAKWNHCLSVVWGIWLCLKRGWFVSPWDGMGIKTLKDPYRIPKQVLGKKKCHTFTNFVTTGVFSWRPCLLACQVLLFCTDQRMPVSVWLLSICVHGFMFAYLPKS